MDGAGGPAGGERKLPRRLPGIGEVDGEVRAPIGAQLLLVETLDQLERRGLPGPRIPHGESDAPAPCQLVHDLPFLPARGLYPLSSDPAQEAFHLRRGDEGGTRLKLRDPLQVAPLQVTHLQRRVGLAPPGISPEAKHFGRPPVQGLVQLGNSVGSPGDPHRLVQQPGPVQDGLALGELPDRSLDHPRGRLSLNCRREASPLFQSLAHPLRRGAAGLEAPLEDPGHLLLRNAPLGVPAFQRRHLVEPGVGHLGESPLGPPDLHLLLDRLPVGGEVLDDVWVDPLQLDEHLRAVPHLHLEAVLRKFAGKRLPVQEPQRLLVLEDGSRFVWRNTRQPVQKPSPVIPTSSQISSPPFQNLIEPTPKP